MKLLDIRASFKDPVHGIVPVTGLEYEIIQHPVFQRLHGVKQLGLAYLVYPQAKHTRFEHSIGAMHVASAMAEGFLKNSRGIEEVLLRGEGEREDFVCFVRLAALLHDLGHLPYSHTTETVMYKCYEKGLLEERTRKLVEKAEDKGKRLHELVGCELMRRLFSDIKRGGRGKLRSILSGVRMVLCGEDDGAWKKVFTEHAIRICREMISGSITDVDRMDYLVRDAHNTGATYGRIDVERLASGLCLRRYGGRVRIVVPSKIISNVEELYYSRYMMYRWVYLHHKIIGLELTYQYALEGIAGEWEKIKRMIDGLLPDPPSELWEIFHPENMWRYTVEYNARIDDSLIDSLLRVAANKLPSTKAGIWSSRLLRRRTPLRPLAKRQEDLITSLALRAKRITRGREASLVEVGSRLMISITRAAKMSVDEKFRKDLAGRLGVKPKERFPWGSGYGFLSKLAEEYLSSKLGVPREAVHVNIIQPISGSLEEDPLVDVGGRLVPLRETSLLIQSIHEAGKVPTVFVFYDEEVCRGEKRMREKALDSLTEFLLELARATGAGAG